MTIDLWVNLLSPEVAQRMSGEYFGRDVHPEDPEELLAYAVGLGQRVERVLVL